MHKKRLIQNSILSILLTTLLSGCMNQQNDFAPESMAYILQVGKKIGMTRAERLKTINDAKRDLIVLDYSEHGDKQSKWTKKEITTLKRNGQSQVVCYLSIGEAEDYRSYWEKQWNTTKPHFLCKENENWPGNFKVKYWQQNWQQVILDYLDEIIAQGFDGVYLDIVDAFQFFEYDAETDDWIDGRINTASNNSYRQDMVNLVMTIAKHSRSKNKDFIIIPQNGSELLNLPMYADVISGIGIEDLFTEGNKKQQRNHTEEVQQNLLIMNKIPKPILVIEYPSKDKMKSYVRDRSKKETMTMLITDRPLKMIGESWR